MQTVTPYLLYEDVEAAADWLCRAFGFQEAIRYRDADGVSFAELWWGSEHIMLGRVAAGYQNPLHAGYHSALVQVTVDDIEAHFEQAQAAGARIMSPPEDKPYGVRAYNARDPEGQAWLFAQHVREVRPEEWGGQQIPDSSVVLDSNP